MEKPRHKTREELGIKFASLHTQLEDLKRVLAATSTTSSAAPSSNHKATRLQNLPRPVRSPRPPVLTGKAVRGRRRPTGGKDGGRVSFALTSLYYPVERFERDLRNCRLQEDYIILPITDDADVKVDAGSLNQLVVSNDPSVCNDWASLAAVWDEFRVLNLRVLYKPNSLIGGGTLTIVPPIASVVDRDSSTVLATYAAASEYSSFEEHDVMTPFHRDAPMSFSADDDIFTDCAAPTARNWIKFLISGGTATIDVGHVQVIYLVQFRGRGP